LESLLYLIEILASSNGKYIKKLAEFSGLQYLEAVVDGPHQYESFELEEMAVELKD
jgi:hypothetical protein